MPEFPHTFEGARKKALSVFAAFNSCLALIAFVYPMYLKPNILTGDYELRWNLIGFLEIWFPVATISWIIGLLILIATLVKKEKVNKKIAFLNQTSLILVIITLLLIADSPNI